MSKTKPRFTPDTVFHVYNHGNAEDNIFREKENYHYFLNRYVDYLFPIIKTYAFCLLPNHFHLMVKVRSEKELTKFFRDEGKDLIGYENLSGLVSKQFSNFLNAYAKAYNKKYDRRGKLFEQSLKRKPVTKDSYFTRLAYYIHQNPVRHGFVQSPSEWEFSSFSIIKSRKETKLNRNDVLDWFGSRDKFVAFHKSIQAINREEFY